MVSPLLGGGLHAHIILNRRRMLCMQCTHGVTSVGGVTAGQVGHNSSLLSYLSYVYSKQSIFGLTQEWFRKLSFSRLECGVHDRLQHSSSGII